MTEKDRTEKREKTKKPRVFLRLLGYMLKYWYIVILALVLTLLSNQLALLGPRYLGNAVDAIGSENGVVMETVKSNVVKMLFCYGISAILSYLLSVVMTILSQKITYKMRKRLFEKLTSLPVSYFDAHTVGDTVSRFSYDIDTINSSLSSDLIQVLTSIYTIFGSLYYMFLISKPLILVFVVTVPISLIFTKYKASKIHPLFSKRSRKLGELNGFAEEMLSGTKTINAYGKSDVICERFNGKNSEAMDAYYAADYSGAIIGPSVNFINNLSLSMIMIFGGILFLLSSNGSVPSESLWFISLGGVTQFVMYSRKFAGPINEFANIISEFQSAFSAAERVFRIIDSESEPADLPTAIVMENSRGKVEVENVDFGYTADKLILKDLSLSALSGQTVAIVGPTGSGKTTIINLLMRFYDVNSGRITVDDLDMTLLTRDSLRKAYTMVLQDTWLFYGSIYDNITYGREGASREEVERAAEAAKIDSFIETLPDGYDTILSDDGVNISKGQKQLITIARAMLAKTEMLILDEATSNVDSRTESLIQKAMDSLSEKRTCFIIAHRLSTIQNADVILVIKDGRIVERGTHTELLSRNGIYSTLYNSQFIEES